MIRSNWFAVLCVLLFSQLFPSLTYGQAPFYQGKTITIVQGRDPGGTGDLRVRALVPFLQKYIPGSPTIIMEFMPGGGSRKAANHVFRSSRPDGLTIGNLSSGMVSLAILGESGVLYDIDKFIYLGSHARYAPYGFISRKGAGFTTKERLAAATGVRIGAPSVGHSLYTMARLFAYMFELKEPRFVTGYTPREIDFALERNEIDARVSILDSLLTRNAHWLDKDMVDINATMDIPKDISYSHPRLAKLLEIEALARSNQERRLIALFRGARGTGQPFVLPPATPPDRVKILREAMRNAFADPDYVKSYEKLTAEPAMPITPEEFEKQLREIPREPEIIDLFKKLSGPGPLPKR